MQILDNINNTIKDDLQKEVKKGSKISIAAACFSIYAYQELKKQLEGVEELHFIFSALLLVSSSTMEASVQISSGVIPIAWAFESRSLFQNLSCSFFIRAKKSAALTSQYT